MGVTREEVDIVALKHIPQCGGIAHIFHVALVENELVGGAARNMHGDKHQTAFLDMSEILLQPAEGLLGNVADVLIVAASTEAVVENDEMRLPTVERVVDRSEVALEGLCRPFIGAAWRHLHVVVADGAEDGHIEWRCGLDVLGIEPLGVADDVAQVDGEYVAASTLQVVGQSAHVGHVGGIAFGEFLVG